MFRGCRNLPALAVAVAAAVAALAGCAVSEDPVHGVARRFGAALAGGDGAQACAFLTDAARRDTETFGRDCAAQLATLPDPGVAGDVEVWGDAAQVRFTRDTVFLLRSPGGWQVSAAGCVAAGDAPYRCQVQG